jgi:hypothetical protein
VWRDCFSGRQLSVSTSMEAMPTSVVTLLGGGGHCCGYLLCVVLRVKTFDHLGLDDGGALRRYPLEGVVVEPGTPRPRCLWCFLITYISLAILALLNRAKVCFEEVSHHHGFKEKIRPKIY